MFMSHRTGKLKKMRLHCSEGILILWLASVVQLNASTFAFSLSYWGSYGYYKIIFSTRQLVRFRHCVCNTSIQTCVLDLHVSNAEISVTDIKPYNIVYKGNYSNYYVCYFNIQEITCERQILNYYHNEALFHFDNAYVCELACVGVGWWPSQEVSIDPTNKGMVNLGPVPAVCSSTTLTTTVETIVSSSTTVSQATHNVSDKYRFKSEGNDSATGTIIGVIFGVVALSAVVSGSIVLWRRKKSYENNVSQALPVNRPLESPISTYISCANGSSVLTTDENYYYELENNNRHLDNDTTIRFCGSNQENLSMESPADNYGPNVVKSSNSSNNEIRNGDGQSKDPQNGVYSLAYCNAEDTGSDPNEFTLANKIYQDGVDSDQSQPFATYFNLNNDLKDSNPSYSNVCSVESSLGNGLQVDINPPVLNYNDGSIKKLQTGQANVYSKLGQQSKDLQHPYNCLSDETVLSIH